MLVGMREFFFYAVFLSRHVMSHHSAAFVADTEFLMSAAEGSP